MAQRRFENKVVVITGAGSGIGRATALAFAAEGARVHVVDLAADRAAAVVAEIAAAGAQATAHTADCTDASAMMRLADRIFSEGHVDVLHNNAGIGHGRAFLETPLSDWHAVLDINLYGVIHGLHAFVPRMVAAGRPGHIVNTASAAGLIGIPKMAPYCAAKFAVVGLSESLAIELAPHNIGVTAICPGVIRTNIIRDGKIEPGGVDKSEIQSFFDRTGSDPESLAAVILDAVHGRASLVVFPWTARATWWLKRSSTRLYRWSAGKLLRWITSRG